MKKLRTLIAVATLVVLVSQPATAQVRTVGGFIWDEADAATSTTRVEGSAAVIFGSVFGTGFAGFDPNKTTGQELGGPLLPLGCGAFGSCAVDIVGGFVNVLRTTIEVDWDGLGLTLANGGVGDDFVIYESGGAGGPEGYAVSVRKTGSGSFTPFRYEFADSFDATHSVFGTAFDLTDFGLGPGETIDAIRIRDLFNSSAAAADTVDDVSGEGNVLFDDGGTLGFTLVTGPLGPGGEYVNGKLDADIVYVVGLKTVQIAGVAGPDHFQCYKIDKRGSSKLPFKPVVDLQDQFGEKLAVKVADKPDFLCAPVDKNDEGVVNEINHLTCYKIKGLKQKVNVEIANQFGEQLLRVKGGKLLCVPSTKTVIP